MEVKEGVKGTDCKGRCEKESIYLASEVSVMKGKARKGRKGERKELI